MSMKKKLARWKNQLTSRASVQEDRPSALFEEQQEKDVPFLDEWRWKNVQPFFFEGDYCLIREVVYPLDYQHGRYRLGELHYIHGRWQEASFAHPLSSKGHEVSDLFFFDTETTGLSSGTGHFIFLLGHARVYTDRVVVRQHFLPHPGAEVALYQSFLTEVDYTTLVTYNGKAFDWPKVKTRHTLIRDAVPKLPAFGHFDLYHAAKRIWKQKLESVRLSNVEKEILQIERKEDVPGFLAPMMYMDFLSTPHPDRIFPVLRHNELDVLSLICLYIHLSKQLLEAPRLNDALEQLETARWLETLGETAAAKSVYERVIEKETKEAWQAQWQLSLLYKKEKRYKEAVDIWEQLWQHGHDTWKIKVGVELAKAYEHHFRDVHAAHRYAVSAYERWKALSRSYKQRNDAQEMEWIKRIERLQRKLHR
ncbi:ribonuclease H-like domain-containing protein [Parageobacillus thermoglucosidasius]|uniref:Ribonuclease H-like domain-containing protein n=1 Tax=Parageobacillus thermoglucosidasius TaxID=1426 RepID=A0AB38QXT6_PARTM|nr:ribonuclease H-like domain-containing protein [Parageobacillus thermoglucosidasius]UOE74960.1 ribonuclease H-like domain-containing protein [Parageobacillus thermoglucosidasius]